VRNTDFDALLRVLGTAHVEFIVVGGVAAIIHGSAHVTYDLDIVYHRTPENLERLAAALQPIEPYLRGAPPGLPFRLDPATLRRGLNFTLTTTLGDLDLLGEIVGGGTFDQLQTDAETVLVGELPVRHVSLPRLIALKRAAGRPKDFDMLAGLEALLEERERQR
jgi:predicted nucleotidyltransferase